MKSSVPAASVPFTPDTTRLKLSKVPKAHWRTMPPLRRVRVDVIEMLEACRIFEVAEQRQPVPPDLRLRFARRAEACGNSRAKRAENRRSEATRWRARRTGGLNFMQTLRHDRSRYAVAGDYVGFSVPRQRWTALPPSQRAQVLPCQ